MPRDTSNVVTVEGAELGRYLFYDPILSRKRTLSCGSCHKQKAAFSDGPNTFSKGGTGELMTRNTMPLFNLAWHKNFFWDGKAETIERQIYHPVRTHNEMDMNWPEVSIRLNNSTFYRAKFKAVFGAEYIDSTLVAKAIGQFERTLISYRSKYDMVLIGKSAFTAEEYEGFNLVNDMTRGDCLHCHTTDSDPLGSTFNFSNNGLDPIADANNYKDKGRGGITGYIDDFGKFKIPSLRNVMLTAPYMHDGRFKTIEDVLNFYSAGVNVCANIDSKMEFAHRKGAHFSVDEQRKIISFLKTLTDSAFICDPAFSDPFKKKQ
ncbi:MAG: cytochrome c peroxidase [Flavipsychrobacter sp.]|nr:cytochrome c peroxidase [Flavipsychrobacter sp.]